jgi:hypothetical protein
MMSAKVEYISIDEQIYIIKKWARNAILIIWIAAISFMLVLIIYLVLSSVKPDLNNLTGYTASKDSGQKNDEIFFSDKTTLVNIGLKMEVMSENVTITSNGSISINKIKYDQKLKRQNQIPKPGFSIKAIPK